MSKKSYWLLKSEPETRIVRGRDVKFSIDDLKVMRISHWDGVRNYEARNILRDQMKIGDLILFYHSNTKIPGIAGLAKVNIVLIKVVKEGYPDSTAFDPNHPYFDAKSDPNNPKWFMVDVQFIKKFDNLISLNQLKSYPELKNMKLLNRGRLSVQPVTKQEFDFISSL